MFMHGMASMATREKVLGLDVAWAKQLLRTDDAAACLQQLHLHRADRMDMPSDAAAESMAWLAERGIAWPNAGNEGPAR